MDIIAIERNYKVSVWNVLANYFDSKGKSGFGQKFWDLTIAWKNKYKNGRPEDGEKFIGSAKWFVTFMDGFHVVKFLWLMHLFAAIVLFKPVTNYLILDICLLYLAFGLGHELFFTVLQIKRKKKA